MTRRTDLAAFGEHGEKWAADHLVALGFEVQHVGRRSTTDLIIDGCLTCEVKSATLTKRRVQRGGDYFQYQFSFRRHGLANNDDLAVLLCFDADLNMVGAFVVPGDRIGDTLRKVNIPQADPAKYAGKYAPFLDGWGLVAELVAQKGNGHEDSPAPVPF